MLPGPLCLSFFFTCLLSECMGFAVSGFCLSLCTLCMPVCMPLCVCVFLHVCFTPRDSV